ncbi:hypothetical protein [Fodinicola feengrottensis]|uniref:hypothetical protein n=1 Tax=Fodinicola feengrottensis TaxID=435914 RepID=UPI0013D622DF|nr:hypothetical protein [Fodinicola feengrottensis]
MTSSCSSAKIRQLWMPPAIRASHQHRRAVMRTTDGRHGGGVHRVGEHGHRGSERGRHGQAAGGTPRDRGDRGESPVRHGREQGQPDQHGHVGGGQRPTTRRPGGEHSVQLADHMPEQPT